MASVWSCLGLVKVALWIRVQAAQPSISKLQMQTNIIVSMQEGSKVEQSSPDLESAPNSQKVC
jgi:hypothetical protein